MAALGALLSADDAGAQWSAEVAVERFGWREHTSPIQVRELGPRFAVGGGFTPSKPRGVLFAYHGRVTFGSVRYNGSFQFDAAKPASGASTYLGTTQGAELRYRWPGSTDGVAGLEVDWWRRRLSSKQREDYRIVSARLGVERGATASHPFVGGAGMRFLLATSEDATIEDSGSTYSLSLSPGLGANPFLHAGYRVARHVTLIAYWDGMRLGRSNQIVLIKRRQPDVIVSQPATDLDVIGVRAVYGF